jgi:putative ABC transport system permease protein
MTAREIFGRMAAWMRRGRLARQLEAELDAHVDLLARDFEHEGLSRDAALARARRQVGHSLAHREESRDYWGFPRLEAFLQDARYAVRGLARSPGFTLTAVVTLGLGIGANAAIFAVIDRLMFRPLPYLRDPASVHAVYLQTTYQGKVRIGSTVPYTRYLDLRAVTHSFAQYAASSEWRLAVGRGDGTRARKVAGVSASLFDFFNIAPERGRFFTAAEDTTPLGAMVAVLSHAFWMNGFGGRDVLGQRLHVGKLDYTVVGIAPEGFVGASDGGAPDLFVPITTIPLNLQPSSATDYFTNYNWDWVEILVRRKADVSVAAADADLTNAYRWSRAKYRAVNPRVLPDSLARPGGIVGSVRSAYGPDPGLESRVLLWVAGVAAIVLVIACANVANLMFARILRRRREIAVRLALGVSRARLVGQFITEGLVLAGIGSVIGLACAQWGGAAIRRMLLPESTPFNIGTDWRTIGVATACALAATLLTSLAPAVLATRADLADALKAGIREGTYRSSRLRSALLILQGTLSVVLLVGAALFVRSLRNVLAIPLGYDPNRVLEVVLDLRNLETDSVAQLDTRRRMLDVARSIPGVEAAARVGGMIFSTSTTSLKVPGIDSVERLGRFNYQVTTPGYFDVMRTRILHGRPFDARDTRGTQPSVVVSESMARALWPGKDPLGQCIQVTWNGLGGLPKWPCTMVIGVAEDALYQSITDEQRLTYYLAADQLDPAWGRTLLVRMKTSNIDAEIERVRRALQAAMPGDGFVVVRPLRDLVDDQERSWRLGATLFVTFGVLALVVAGVGLYGVIAYNVVQRMHELGVRVALGAVWTDIVRLVVTQSLAMAAAGVAIGLGIALLASPWIEPLLYKQSPRDPVAYGAISAIMLLVAIIASAVPALRAAAADPNRALRAE